MGKKRKQQWIYPPEGGWKARTLYRVEVAVQVNNPVHIATFYTGFLQDVNPCGYNQLISGGHGEPYEIGEVYYLKALEVLCTTEKLESRIDNQGNYYKTPAEMGMIRGVK